MISFLPMDALGPRRRRQWLRAAALASLLSPMLAGRPAGAQGMATADRLQAPGWWPTKGTAPRADYVGAATCVR